MKTAIWVTCPGMNEGQEAHTMRYYCSSCGPYWEQYPVCPDCQSKLGLKNPAKSGDRRKCPQCKTFVKVEACDVSIK